MEIEMEKDLKEILENQCNYLGELREATTVIKSKDSLKDELKGMKQAITKLSNLVHVYRKHLEIMKNQNEQCQTMLSALKNLDTKMMDMDANIPTELIQDYKLSLLSIKSPEIVNNLSLKSNMSATNGSLYQISVSDETPLKDCKKILFKDPNYLMKHVTPEEFSRIPKYIIGRQSLDSLNDFIKILNSILNTKYTLLSMGQAQARKRNELALYWKYTKEQKIVDKVNDYSHFFGNEDYEKYTNLKLDKIKFNFLVALRHLKRIHNFRIDKNTYYIVTQ